jgi:hypothetical protein
MALSQLEAIKTDREQVWRRWEAEVIRELVVSRQRHEYLPILWSIDESDFTLGAPRWRRNSGVGTEVRTFQTAATSS